VSATQAIPILFYTKPGCHLCEDIAEELDVLAEQWSVQITTVDITSDLEIHRRYWDKIPVVVVDGHTFVAPIAPKILQTAVANVAKRATC
jgi:thiol-disulfide isomerase/thioredoxin